MQNPLKTNFVTRIALAVVILCCGFRVQACLNGYGSSFTEMDKRGEAEYPHPVGHIVDTAGYRIQQSLPEWKEGLKSGLFEFASNYGIYLIYAHRFVEAEAQLRAVASRWPNQYGAAANLGTVLEINGKNEEALQWIKRSVEINPNAHQGSEWIHVKILEAKIAGTESLDLTSTWGIDFGNELIPKTTASRHDVKMLQKQLFYQLNERITFIPPQNPTVAALLFELGNTSFFCSQMVPALKTYKLAVRYGADGQLIDDRIAYVKRYIRKN